MGFPYISASNQFNWEPHKFVAKSGWTAIGSIPTCIKDLLELIELDPFTPPEMTLACLVYLLQRVATILLQSCSDLLFSCPHHHIHWVFKQQSTASFWGNNFWIISTSSFSWSVIKYSSMLSSLLSTFNLLVGDFVELSLDAFSFHIQIQERLCLLNSFAQKLSLWKASSISMFQRGLLGQPLFAPGWGQTYLAFQNVAAF